MNQAMVFGLIGAFLGGGLGILIATSDESEGPVFIASNQAVTEAQLRDKLHLQGWVNIEVTQQDMYFEATGSKDGRPKKIMINSASGRLVADDSDDD